MTSWVSLSPNPSPKSGRAVQRVCLQGREDQNRYNSQFRFTLRDSVHDLVDTHFENPIYRFNPGARCEIFKKIPLSVACQTERTPSPLCHAVGSRLRRSRREKRTHARTRAGGLIRMRRRHTTGLCLKSSDAARI